MGGFKGTRVQEQHLDAGLDGDMETYRLVELADWRRGSMPDRGKHPSCIRSWIWKLGTEYPLMGRWPYGPMDYLFEGTLRRPGQLTGYQDRRSHYGTRRGRPE